MGRILRADPGVLPDAWTTIVPEASDVMDDFSIVGGKIYVVRLKDVKSETSVYTLDGKPAGTIDFDGIGSASGVVRQDRPIATASSVFNPSFSRPRSTASTRSPASARSLPSLKFPSIPASTNSSRSSTNQRTAPGFPCSSPAKKALKQDGTERLLMTGYGGFDVSITPAWNPAYAWWMEQGGWFALPNLRGGGEYGEHWHEQGMFEKKQNVFDDWFAAAEYLIANKYTSPEHFAITGRSNGGLLMGAAMTQHPELFSAILCGYPLLDMLRYQKFKVGYYWTTEYGSADNEKQFPYLLKYSPYQNVKAGTAYPAIMFFTGDSDTRVDPLHARKMTALMQAASSSGRPILLHYSLAGGHSAGVSVDQKIQDDADQLTFLWTETGKPKSVK